MDNLETLLLDSLPHWAMLIDSKTRTILAANKLAKELGSKIQGQCWDDFGHRQALTEEHIELIISKPERKRDNCIKCTFCEADEAIQNKKTHVAEVEIDGLTWQTYWVPVKDDMYLHYAIDITETKKLEQLKVDKEKLSVVIKTLGAITHEMSQPLMVVTGALDLLAMDNSTDSVNSQYIIQLRKSLDRLNDITHKLQRVSQVKMKQYLKGEILDLEASSSDATIE
jgi:nitrogen-specific signal transduction histidine kinase